MFQKSFWDGKNRRVLAIVCLALVVSILAVYLQVRHQPYLDFDDDFYVKGNVHVKTGLSLSNILWAFTAFYAGNWHPLAWITHMADVQLFGMNPAGHHLTNVFIHTASTLVLLQLLLRWSGSLGRSAFVAALFALHPMHVESVAWISERKDVLSALFAFLTILFYGEYVAKRRIGLYLLTLFSFALGLMSKSMLVTLPILLLMLDFWPLHRLENETGERGVRELLRKAPGLVAEKLPFFALSLLTGIFTIFAQHGGGATRSFSLFPFDRRVENALVGYCRYIGKLLWPHDLAIYYPYPTSIALGQVIAAVIFLFAVSAAAIFAARRFPYLAVGWFWFIVTLLPVIGLFQVGDQSMADRYSYIPATGLFIMAAWGVADLARRLPRRQKILPVLGIAIIATLAGLTWRQLGYWQDNVSLYRHSLQCTTGNYVLHFNLGLALDRKGALDEAIDQYRQAIKIQPAYLLPYNNLGVALAKEGRLDEAIIVFEKGLRLDPDDVKGQNNLRLARQLRSQQW